MSRKKRKKKKKKKKKSSHQENETPQKPPVLPSLSESIFQLMIAYSKTQYAHYANLDDSHIEIWLDSDNKVTPDSRWGDLSQEEASMIVDTMNRQYAEIHRYITEVRGVPKLTLTGTEFPFPSKGA